MAGKKFRFRVVDDWASAKIRGGTAVVIDVIRFSTTLCALLHKKRRPVYVAESPRSLSGEKGLSGADVFSELEFQCRGRRYDNSPYHVLHSRSARPAYVTSTNGSKALFACLKAEKVLIGCFANFNVLVRSLRRSPGVIWLVLASSARLKPLAVEDGACAQAIERAVQGPVRGAAQELSQLWDHPRLDQFIHYRPAWGDKDLRVVLKLNSLPHLPRVRPERIRRARAAGSGVVEIEPER